MTRSEAPEAPGASALRSADGKGTAGLALFPLLLAIVITFAVTLDPRLLADAAGKADHLAASALFWAMSAGYVRGVGFIPRAWPLRWLLSTGACILALTLAVLRLAA